MNVLKMQKIKTILLEEWDPFCVGDNPNLTDEYDSVANGVMHLLGKGSSAKELSEYLLEMENKLHAPIVDSQRKKVVISLQKLK